MLFQHLSLKTLTSDTSNTQPLTPIIESWGINPCSRISPQVEQVIFPAGIVSLSASSYNGSKMLCPKRREEVLKCLN